MASHVAKGASAVIDPASPFEWLIVWVIGALRGRPKKEIPMNVRGNRRRGSWPVHALGPDRAIAPDMNLMNRADSPALDYFDRPTQPAFGASLVSHLRRNFVFGRGLAHEPRFINRVRERLLAIDMFAHAHRHNTRGGMMMVRSRDDHRIHVLHLLKH